MKKSTNMSERAFREPLSPGTNVRFNGNLQSDIGPNSVHKALEGANHAWKPPALEKRLAQVDEEEKAKFAHSRIDRYRGGALISPLSAESNNVPPGTEFSPSKLEKVKYVKDEVVMDEENIRIEGYK